MVNCTRVGVSEASTGQKASIGGGFRVDPGGSTVGVGAGVRGGG